MKNCFPYEMLKAENKEMKHVSIIVTKAIVLQSTYVWVQDWVM